LQDERVPGDELHVSRWYQVDRDRILQTANAVRKKNHEPESDPPLIPV